MKEESLLLLSDLQKLINQVVLIDYTIIILGGAGMEKEYIAGEPQRYEIGGRVFIVEPRYRKDGESMADILLKLMFADLDEEMRAANKTTTD